jgi:hypothetical protein
VTIRTILVLIQRFGIEGLFAEEIVERRLRTLDRSGILGHVGPRLRLEVIAEIRLVLLPNLLRGGLLAMLRIRGVVLDAHLAHVELGVAGLAGVKPAEGEA